MSDQKSVYDKSALISKLKELQSKEGDAEYCHQEADRILCELLIVTGHIDVVREYVKIKKWYS